MTSLLKLYICGTPALENLRGCLTFAYANIIAMLLGLLVSLRQMTTRLRLCVPNNVNLPEFEAEVYGLSSDSWRRVTMSLRPDVVVSYIDPFWPATFVSEALHCWQMLKRVKGNSYIEV